MSPQVTITLDLADAIPACTGLLIFASVLLAGTNPASARFHRNRIWSWSLGAASQVLLFLFGVLTGTYTFGSHVLVAGAFLANLYRGARRRHHLG